MVDQNATNLNNDESVKVAETKEWRDHTYAEIKQQRKADNDTCNEPNLRTTMCILVSELGSLLDDHAAIRSHAPMSVIFSRSILK